MQSHKNPFAFFDDFVLRTPTFSINSYYELGSKKKIQKKNCSQYGINSAFSEHMFI